MNCKYNQVGRVPFKKVDAGFDGVAFKYNLLHTHPEISDRTFRATVRDQVPSFKCVADPGKVLPRDGFIVCHMKNAESGFCDYSQFQCMGKRHLAGGRKIRRMENRLKFHFLPDSRRTVCRNAIVEAGCNCQAFTLAFYLTTKQK